MGVTLQEFLGTSNLTDVLQTTDPGLPRYYPESFDRVTRQVLGRKIDWTEVTDARQNATASSPGSPAKVVNGVGGQPKSATAIRSFEVFNHEGAVLDALKGYHGQIASEHARREIDRQVANFKSRFVNLRRSAINSTLFKGKIWIGDKGELLFSNAGAVNTIDFGVPADRQNQGGGVIAASWATTSTKIADHITALKKAQTQAGKAPIVHAFYGGKIAGYITTNDTVKELIRSAPRLAEEQYGTGEIPQGFLGLQWHPAYAAFGVNKSKQVVSWLGDDELVLTPEPNGTWWEMVEGSESVPTALGGVYGDPVAAMNALEMAFGMFSYATVGHNPVGIEHFAGDNFLPILRDPGAIWQLDVTP